MKAGGGKQKGAQFERAVCVALSRWVTGGKREDCFWRSAMSGGRSTVARQKGKSLGAQAGDVTATYLSGHKLTEKYLIECKFYKDLQIESFLINGKGNLATFWDQVVADADAFAKIPMLVAKQNRMPTLLIMPGYAHALKRPDLCLTTVHAPSADAALYKFDVFLERVKCPFS